MTETNTPVLEIQDPVSDRVDRYGGLAPTKLINAHEFVMRFLHLTVAFCATASIYYLVASKSGVLEEISPLVGAPPQAQDVPILPRITENPTPEPPSSDHPQPSVPNTGVAPVFITIGDPLDPHELMTWPHTKASEFINIGYPVDPDDPSSWPHEESAHYISIGYPIDHDDPSSWPQSGYAETVNVGTPLDAAHISDWSSSESNQVFIIGDPIYPDAPSPSTR